MDPTEREATSESVHPNLLEAAAIMHEVHERRKRAVAVLDAADARDAARALTAEGVQAWRHAQQLMSDATALVARAERLLAEARPRD